ncbi:MAG: hypothetical protein J6D20_04825 [Clostridia bacterium]|nr:hypothetical protein [Clostridia bacterium]
MKKFTKKNMLEFGFEVVAEIIFGIVAFLIGWGILLLFGIDVFSEDYFDLAILIGALTFIAVFIIAAIIINNIKRNR